MIVFLCCYFTVICFTPEGGGAMLDTKEILSTSSANSGTKEMILETLLPYEIKRRKSRRGSDGWTHVHSLDKNNLCVKICITMYFHQLQT